MFLLSKAKLNLQIVQVFCIIGVVVYESTMWSLVVNYIADNIRHNNLKNAIKCHFHPPMSEY